MGMLIENLAVDGWAAAIRGMRNPLNSWAKSDTDFDTGNGVPKIGENDMRLMKKLVAGGSEHRKFLRMINVTFDVTAPLYWWQQLDTYKVGTVRNSCSKMHKLLYKKFEMEDFATDSLQDEAKGVLQVLIDQLNNWRKRYFETPEKQVLVRRELWDAILGLLPESYCQKSTVQFNYEVLRTICRQRRGHKLLEWQVFITWVGMLPYAAELIMEE